MNTDSEFLIHLMHNFRLYSCYQFFLCIRWSSCWWVRTSPLSSLATGSQCRSTAPPKSWALRARCLLRWCWHMWPWTCTPVCFNCWVFLTGCSRERYWAMSVLAGGESKGDDDAWHAGPADVEDQGVGDRQGHLTLSGTGHTWQSTMQGGHGLGELQQICAVWGKNTQQRSQHVTAC